MIVYCIWFGKGAEFHDKMIIKFTPYLENIALVESAKKKTKWKEFVYELLFLHIYKEERNFI